MVIMFDVGAFNIAKIKLVRQSEISECGLACIAMLAKFHGINVDLRTLRMKFNISNRGSTLRTLIEICDGAGLSSRAVGVRSDALHKLKLPAILHWESNHFVVLERISKGRMLVHNPIGSSNWIDSNELSKSFSGAALEVLPNLSFAKPGMEPRSGFGALWGRLIGHKKALAQTVILSLIMQFYILISPYYMQVAIDNTLPSMDLSLLTTLAIGFGALVFINAGASLFRGMVLLNAGVSVGFGIAVNICRHLFRLPVDWFQKRAVGDVLSRFQSILPLQHFLTEGAVAAIVDGMLAVTTLILMFFFSPSLTFIAITALLLIFFIRMVAFSLERKATEDGIVAAHREQTYFLESLRGIEVLRLYGAEAMRHAFWQTLKIDALNAEIVRARIGIGYGVANAFIFGLEAIVSVWLGVTLIIEGQGLSVGMLFAFTAYKLQFISKSENLISQFINFKMLGLHFERLEDIFLTKEDRSFHIPDIEKVKISGEIELKNVQYRYTNFEPNVLSDINLRISPGEHIAIIGASGCGKSTLVKIILGVLDPQHGQMLVDGIPLNDVGHRNFRKQISGILQDDTLFAGTLAENIALFCENIDMDRVIRVSNIAAIHADIMKMPMKYETLVGDMGSSLSGGQKQRIILARALYRDPQILIIDEGTAHLDSVNEDLIVNAIRKLGITRIIIAHRQDTIRSADRVLILENGQLKES